MASGIRRIPDIVPALVADRTNTTEGFASQTLCSLFRNVERRPSVGKDCLDGGEFQSRGSFRGLERWPLASPLAGAGQPRVERAGAGCHLWPGPAWALSPLAPQPE